MGCRKGINFTDYQKVVEDEPQIHVTLHRSASMKQRWTVLSSPTVPSSRTGFAPTELQKTWITDTEAYTKLSTYCGPDARRSAGSTYANSSSPRRRRKVPDAALRAP